MEAQRATTEVTTTTILATLPKGTVMSFDQTDDAQASTEESRALLVKAAHIVLDSTSNAEKAVEALLERVRKDAVLREALLAPWERQAAQTLIGGMIRKRRSVVWNRPAAPDARVHVLGAANRRLLLDMMVPGGKRLRFCDKADVLASAESYRKQAQDNTGKWHFFAAIGVKLPEGKMVQDHFAEADLEAIHTKVAA